MLRKSKFSKRKRLQIQKVKPIDPSRVCSFLEEMTAECLSDTGNKELDKFAEMVYKFCHITRNSPCINVHQDWIDEFRKAESDIKQPTTTS